MKILLLTDRMDIGGAETHIALLARTLRKLGHEVALLSCGGRLANELRDAGIRQILFPTPSRAPFSLWQCRRRLKKLLREERFDILHAHARRPAFLMRGLGRKYGGAEIVTVHAMFSLSPLFRRVCYWGNATIAVSEDLRTYVCREYCVPPERVRVIANGIDTEVFFSEEKTPREEVRILFASRLDEDCSLGAELLCKLAPILLAHFPNLRIGIAGGGNAMEHIQALADEANALANATAVTLYGRTEDMATLLREQDIFVGVSRAAMEAAACGCAVILCGNEGYLGILNRESARTAVLTNLCCRNAEMPTLSRLQSDLLALIKDPSLRRAYAKEGHDYVLQAFCGERMCRETLGIYERNRLTPPKKFLTVGGYFGCGNLGDDLILQGFLEGMHACAPATHIRALTGEPHRDARRFAIPCTNRRAPLSVLWALLTSHAFLCGGGSLLQNATSNRSLAYYLHLLRAAARLQTTTILYAAGIGPLRGHRASRRTAKALARCRYISLRDPISRQSVEALGIDRARLHEGADPALLCPLPPPSRALAILQENSIPPKTKYICLILKGGQAYRDLRHTLIAAVRMVTRRHSLQPILLCFDSLCDRQATQEAARILGGRSIPLQEGTDAAAILSHAQICVCMRLHAMILSTMVGVCAVGVAADEDDSKLSAFAHLVGQRTLAPPKVTVAELVEEMEAALEERTRLRPILLDSVAELRKKTQKDLENITAMIYNSDSDL